MHFAVNALYVNAVVVFFFLKLSSVEAGSCIEIMIMAMKPSNRSSFSNRAKSISLLMLSTSVQIQAVLCVTCTSKDFCTSCCCSSSGGGPRGNLECKAVEVSGGPPAQADVGIAGGVHTEEVHLARKSADAEIMMATNFDNLCWCVSCEESHYSKYWNKEVK